MTLIMEVDDPGAPPTFRTLGNFNTAEKRPMKRDSSSCLVQKKYP